MKKSSVIAVLCMLMMAALPSCSLVKCRYSSGWKLGSGKPVEHTTASNSSQPTSKKVKLYQETQDSLIKTGFDSAKLDNVSEVPEAVNVYFKPVEQALSSDSNKLGAPRKDSGMNLQDSDDNYEFQERKTIDFSWIFNLLDVNWGSNEFAIVVFVFMVIVVIIALIIWAFILLLKFIFHMIKKARMRRIKVSTQKSFNKIKSRAN